MSTTSLFAKFVGRRGLNLHMNLGVWNGSTAEGRLCLSSLLGLSPSTLCLQELSQREPFPPELYAFKLIFFGNCLGTADCRNEMAQNWLNNVYANTDVVRALFSYSSRSSLSKAFGRVSGLLSSTELVGAWFRLGNYQNPAETLFWCIFFPSLTSAICGASGLPSRRSCLCLLISALPSKAFASHLLLVPKSPTFSDTVSVTWLTAALLWFYSISVHPALLVRGLLALLKAWC